MFSVCYFTTRTRKTQTPQDQTAKNGTISMIKPLRPIAIAVLPLVLLVTACGSDSDSDSSGDTAAATSDAPASSDAADAADAGGANADVETFCTSVDEFVDAMNAMLEDPTKGDAAALATQGQDLVKVATDLGVSIDSADTARLEECAKKLTEIGS